MDEWVMTIVLLPLAASVAKRMNRRSMFAST
jgi:hypothetical protein